MPEVERAGAPTEMPTFEQVVEQALAEQERQQGQHTFDGGAALLGSSAPCAATGQWSSGEKELAVARHAGQWADGAKIGRGHGSPYLQMAYAQAIRNRTKTVEGRPGKGWLSCGGVVLI